MESKRNKTNVSEKYQVFLFVHNNNVPPLPSSCISQYFLHLLDRGCALGSGKEFLKEDS
jgi:hypothetical protein